MTIIKTFSIKDAFSTAYKDFTNNITTMIMLAIAFFVLHSPITLWTSSWVQQVANRPKPEDLVALYKSFQSTLTFLASISIFGLLASQIVEYFTFALGKRFHEKNHSLEHDFSVKNFLRFFLARFIYKVKFLLGTLLFFFPGIYLLLKNFFAGYSLIDDSSKGFAEDAAISHILTRGVKLKILLLTILQMGPSIIVGILVGPSMILGLITLFFNSLLSVYFYLVYVAVYYQLKTARMPQ